MKVGPRGISVRIPAPAADSADPQIDAAWRELTAANPRLFDGPLLLVDRVEDDVIHARPGRYRTLATATMLGRTVRSLGVQGVVIGRDRAGQPHVLFGRRSDDTRIYGGRWENAPSGSLEPPRHNPPTLALPDFARALAAEGTEELGIDLADAEVHIRALLDDATAQSLDLVLHVALRGIIDPRGSACALADHRRWEYLDTAWVRIDDLRAWHRDSKPALSPPTAALMRWLGWL